MFEVMTYEEILDNYYNILPEDMDTREGTLAYIAGSAVAMRLAELYEEIKLVEDNCYADTAVGDRLENIASILGLTRRAATKAVVKMEGDMTFGVGDVFTGGEYEYIITEVKENGYLAECTTAGTEGNSYVGEVLPKENKEGYGGVSIIAIVAKGEEIEDDDSLRTRYMERLNCPLCTGNLSYYKEAINSVTGVGGFKVIPVADGIGTVKVVITDTDCQEADEELVSYVKEVLDPEESSGQGYGIVPVGHRVEVVSAEAVDVELVVELEPASFQAGYCMYGRTYLPKIFAEMNKTWDQNDRMVLWDRVIEDYFLSLGATDVNVISMNGCQNRLVLGENQILGGIKINGT